jgi:hypothetical protein
MEDGRELPLIKLETTSESHPFYTGTQKSVDNLGGRVEKFRNPAPERKAAHRLLFFCPAPAGATCIVPCREPPHPRHRHPVGRAPPAALALLLLLRWPMCCPAFWARALAQRRRGGLRRHARNGRGPQRLVAAAGAGRQARRHRPAAATGWARPPSRLLPWLPADLAARVPFALLLALTLACTWYATYHLARHRRRSRWPLPSAARPTRSTTPAPWPTPPAGAGGQPGPGPAGPRDHARLAQLAIAALLLCRARLAPLPRNGLAARAGRAGGWPAWAGLSGAPWMAWCWAAAGCWALAGLRANQPARPPTGHERPGLLAGHRAGLPAGLALGAGRRATARLAWAWIDPWSGAAGPAAALVHLAGLAAGAVDAVALAPQLLQRMWRCRCGSLVVAWSCA